jgi:Tfp pilus assembly protein PilO
MKKESFYSIFFLLMSALILFFFVIPKKNSISVLNSELSQKKLEFQNSDKYFQEVIGTFEKLQKYQEEISKIDSALPEDPSLPSLFDFLQKLSSQSGLLLENVGSGNFSEEGKLKKWTVALKLKGDYPLFKNFISTLEKSARLIKVEKVSLSSEKESSSFDITISVYSY